MYIEYGKAIAEMQKKVIQPFLFAFVDICMQCMLVYHSISYEVRNYVILNPETQISTTILGSPLSPHFHKCYCCIFSEIVFVWISRCFIGCQMRPDCKRFSAPTCYTAIILQPYSKEVTPFTLIFFLSIYIHIYIYSNKSLAVLL